MKRSCRQTLLFVAFSLLTTTIVSAAEIKLKSNSKTDQNTWEASYEMLTDYSIVFSADRPVEKQIPEEYSVLVEYLKDFSGVVSIEMDHSNKILKLTSNSQLDLPQIINK